MSAMPGAFIFPEKKSFTQRRQDRRSRKEELFFAALRPGFAPLREIILWFR